MRTTTLRLRLLLAATAALLAGLTARAENALPKESPFMPATGPAAVVAANESYELAAVSVIGKKTSVNVFDKQAKKGRWVDVGQTLDGITVKSYDAGKELAAVVIGGSEKQLSLRKPTLTANGPHPVASAAPAVNAWNIPPPAAAPAGPTATVTPAIPQPPPATPGTVAHQEQEARMLVSDLLEIGMAQRKAYEEAQKKAGQNGGAAAPAPAAPDTTPPPTP